MARFEHVLQSACGGCYAPRNTGGLLCALFTVRKRTEIWDNGTSPRLQHLSD